jgi:hypothetical protein
MIRQITQNHRTLTEHERSLALQLISAMCHPEDRQPEEVIMVTYKGDTDAYIWDMLAFDDVLAARLKLKS